MPLTTCTSPIHHGTLVTFLDDGDGCPICAQIGDLDHDLGELRATLAAMRPLADRLVEMIAGTPEIRILVPASPPHGRETFGTVAPTLADEPTPPTGTAPEPTYPPAAESKALASEILNRLPIEARIEIYKAAGIDPGKGVATWRGRPQAAYDLMLACHKAEAALTPATAPYTDTDDSDTDPGEGEPVDTNGSDDQAPAPPADPERDMAMRRRAVVLRALPYAELRNLHHAATGTLASVSTPSEELIRDVLDHEFSAAEPAAADPDNEVPF
ncbi:MAG TPA: hypothetical protein VI911_04180 [Patescibacteria group bacterium]|nr:hypothetical protein [Patescibacteria group bacterium]